MKFEAHITIMPHAELLDPQGKTVSKNMVNLNIHGVEDVRIGKFVQMIFEANDQADAESIVEQACKKILANVIMESYEYTVAALENV